MRYFRTSFVIFVLAAGAAVGQESKPAVTVFIDPATGKIRQPTPVEAENLAGAARARTAAEPAAQVKPLDMRYAAGGAVGIKLGPESLNYVVVTRKPDGKLSMDCVTGEKAAEKAVSDAK